MPSAQPRPLTTILQQQLQVLNELKHSLEREHTALADQDTETLRRLAAQKQDLARRIDHLERERTRHTASPQDESQGDWLELVKLARECEKLNQVNGVIVHSNQQRVKQALGLLRAGVASADTYGADGSARLGGNSRSLAQA